MTTLSKQQKLFIISGLVAAVGIFAVVREYRPGGEGEEMRQSATTTVTALSGGGSVKVGGSGAVTVSSISEAPKGGASSASAPDLRAPLTIITDMSPEAQTLLRSKFTDAQTALAKNPKDFQSLMTLGTLRKMAGDYAGAAADWSYTSSLYPKEPSPYESLGSLYLDFIKNYPKAENAYMAVIRYRADDLSAYHNLYSLYTDYGYKANTDAAEQILKQGIAANPKAYDLHVLLARYYVAHKNPTAARPEYESALSLVKATGQTDLATQISAEEAKL